MKNLMNRKILAIAIVIVAVVGAVALMRQSSTDAPAPAPKSVARQQAAPPAQPAHAAERVPAHYETAPDADSLAPTLSPEKFTGLTRDAYKAVAEMPQTIAQLPCYCHCDEGFGHKSLQSCFVDDHAAHCDICVKEALAAYRLRKQGLSAPQIRERIVAEYAN
jgi:hypothetical protein